MPRKPQPPHRDGASATSPKLSLPPGADFAFLRKRAKELLRAARAGDAAARDRLGAAVPHTRRAAASEPERPRLADAQHAVAREHGFVSWTRLLRHVEDHPPVGVAAERLLAAVRENDARAAARALALCPEAGDRDLWTASAAGRPARLHALLEERPGASPAVRAEEKDAAGWTPLLYACASPLHRERPEIAAGLRRIVADLLAAGADPNGFTPWGDGENDPNGGRLPALYRACLVDHAEVAELLLRHGADPNDGESIYHAAELDHRACLEVLLRHGAEPSARHPRWRNTPLYFLVGYREGTQGAARADRGIAWLLEHGADPNVTSYDSAETPLHRVADFGRSRALAERLLDHGAAVDPRRADGRTPYALAVRRGNVAVAELLAARGADVTAATPADRFLGACLRGDGPAARALLAAEPALVAGFSAADRQVASIAAEEDNAAAMRLLVELGFDLASEGEWGGTPLHIAAWFGRVAMVRLLLDFGAPIDRRDSRFGSSPLGWACHGSTHCRRADDDYCAVVEALLDAGAERAPSINREGETPESMARRKVAALLRRRGFAPQAEAAQGKASARTVRTP